MMNALFRSWRARKARPFSVCVNVGIMSVLGVSREKVESPINDFGEVSLFTEDDPLRLHHRGVLTRFGIFLQTCSVCLIGGETIKGDQAPRHIVRAFIRKKISDQV